MIRRVHMIESGGRGGVFNHSVEVAAGLRALGVDVVLHTAADAEEAPATVQLCRCIKWHRRSASRLVRQLATTARYTWRTLPHLLRAICPQDVVHLQGLFALTPELIAVARMRGAAVVCSPHNTFARSGAPGGGRSLKAILAKADRVLVYSEADVARLATIRPDAVRVPLVQWTPPPRPELVQRWRQELCPDGAKLALMPGQVRADKNPHEFVRAVVGMDGWRGAIIGEDMGPGKEIDALIDQVAAPVTTSYRYVDVESFVALVAAADVVVAPYEVASQSGVLAVAAQLGVPTAVAPIGGLRELGTVVARDNTASSIRDAIGIAAQQSRNARSNLGAAKTYLAEYAAAQRGRPAEPEGGSKP